MDTYRKILVINLLHIGDLLLATPALRTLRTNFPGAHITLLADAKIDDLVKFNQNIDELISVDKKGYHNKLGNFIRLIGSIRKQHYDLVINFHPNERASALAAFSGGKKIVGYASQGFGIFFNHLIHNTNFDFAYKNRPDVVHQAKEHLNTLKTTLGITQLDDRGLEMWLDEATIQKAQMMWNDAFLANGLQPNQIPHMIVGFNTGASWPTKRWTPSGFAAVADALVQDGFGVVFFGGPMDVENVKEIKNMMANGHHPAVIEFTGKIRLMELAALMKQCSVVLTNDSGPMHVAIANQVPVVAIFGSSNEVGFGPYNGDNITLTMPEITCRPCGKHLCPTGHECMSAITHEKVLKTIEDTMLVQGELFIC
jgi:heptosyltransferase II